MSSWFESMSEADAIFVLDTGSTDNTVQKLKDLGVIVMEKEINPWRFDVARNESLNMIPDDYDICVCTDLDEVFEKGWREKLEKIWNKDVTRLAYNYNWQLDNNNNPLVNFYIEKIHSRKNYIWKHPVHEVLEYVGAGKENKLTTDEITLNHYPDLHKSRKGYLKLLELSVKEDPEDDRNMHYLGREYMYYKKWNKAIDTLIKHLSLKSAAWKDERSASMRFISRCYLNLNRYDEAKMWLDKAINETPYLRDPYVEKALLAYHLNDWQLVEDNCLKALEITNHTKSYINEIFSWDNTIFDLLSLSYFYQQKYDKAIYYAEEALKMDKDNERIKKNLSIFKEEFSKNN